MRNQVAELAESLCFGAHDEREAAICLHDYVRDSIRFGGTHLFDDATPEQTIDMGVGHCNPQGRLLVALMQAVGIRARLHMVLIRLEVLRGIVPAGIFPFLSEGGLHAYVEVDLGRDTFSIDSFIPDSSLYQAAMARLHCDKLKMGFGVHIDGTNTWDGTQDAFSQLVGPEMLVGEIGVVDDPATFFRSKANTNRIAGLSVATWLNATNVLLFGRLNSLGQAKLDRFRRS